MATTEQQAGDRYLIRKRGMYYRPNAEGYTCEKAHAGRFTLEQAISHSHPNGPDGPRDGIDYVLADEPAAPCLASVSSASAEGASGMKTWLGGDAAPADWGGGRVLFRHGGTSTSRPGEGMCWSHGMLGGGKTDIIAYTPKSEPVPATNQAVKWRERWYGSEPQKGSAIVDERGNLIAYFGGDETTHKATTAAVSAHNASMATPPATSQEGEALAGYRAAVSWISADSWDGCSDCIEILKAARAADVDNMQAADTDATARELARIRRHLPALAATPTPPAVSDEALRMAVAKLLPIGNDSLPGDRVIAIYVRMDELRALHDLSRSQVSA